jgi:hypothetical protein
MSKITTIYLDILTYMHTYIYKILMYYHNLSLEVNMFIRVIPSFKVMQGIKNT